MTVMEAIQTRKSIRAYQQKPIEEEKIQQIVEAGRMAPSATNQQAWKFVVVTDPALRQQMMAACHNQACVGSAPMVMAVCTNEVRNMSCGSRRAPWIVPSRWPICSWRPLNWGSAVVGWAPFRRNRCSRCFRSPRNTRWWPFRPSATRRRKGGSVPANRWRKCWCGSSGNNGPTGTAHAKRHAYSKA